MSDLLILKFVVAFVIGAACLLFVVSVIIGAFDMAFGPKGGLEAYNRYRRRKHRDRRTGTQDQD